MIVFRCVGSGDDCEEDQVVEQRCKSVGRTDGRRIVRPGAQSADRGPTIGFVEITASLQRAFDMTRPVEADGKEYVDWQNALGYDDVKKLMARQLRRSESGARVLFTGLRGSGKSSELRRLQTMLRQQEDNHGFFVVTVDCAELLDLDEEVSAMQVVLAIAGRLLDELYGKVPAEAKEAGKALKALLAGILGAAEAAVPFGKVGPSLKLAFGDPTARSRLSDRLENSRKDLFDRINAVLGQAKAEQKEIGNDRFAVLVDSLDRIPERAIAEGGGTNHEALFLNSSATLKGLACDLVYTLPIEFVFRHLASGRLLNDWGSTPVQLGVIAPVSRDQVVVAGLDQLLTICAERARLGGLAGADDLLDHEALRDLCLRSGGHLRSLFQLIRGALDRSDSVPLDQRAVTKSIAAHQRATLDQLNAEHRRVIGEVAATHKRPAHAADEKLFIELLRNQNVLPYIDDAEATETWFGVHPLSNPNWAAPGATA